MSQDNFCCLVSLPFDYLSHHHRSNTQHLFWSLIDNSCRLRPFCQRTWKNNNSCKCWSVNVCWPEMSWCQSSGPLTRATQCHSMSRCQLENAPGAKLIWQSSGLLNFSHDQFVIRFLRIKIINERIASKHIILCKTDNGDQQIIWSLKLTPNSLDCWAAVLIFKRGQELRWAGCWALTEGLRLGPGKQKVDQPGAGGSVQWPVMLIVWQLNSQNWDQQQIFPCVTLHLCQTFIFYSESRAP